MRNINYDPDEQCTKAVIKDEIHLNTPINQGMPQPLKKLFDKKYTSLKMPFKIKQKTIPQPNLSY